MGAIYAELHVDGRVYPLLRCTYGVSQGTDGRGRPIEQVRHNYVDGEMVVPRDRFMTKWAATVYMPLAGYIVFSGGPGLPAMETVSWEAGHCVGHTEIFVAGSITDGCYNLRFRIAAARLVFSVGPPAPFVAPMAREHGAPPVAAVVASSGDSPQKLPVIPLADNVPPAAWVGKKDLPAYTEAHKKARWAEYQRDKASKAKVWAKERWANNYESSRNNNIFGLARERLYAQTMGATSSVLKTPFTLRQIDMYIAPDKYCGQLKTGPICLRQQEKEDLEKDEYLVSKGYQVEYILEKGASKPLLAALTRIGASVKMDPQIP